MARTNPSKSVCVAGEVYSLIVCGFCGGAAPVFLDKRGRPYTRCQVCDSRTFASTASLELSKRINRVQDHVWPPDDGWSNAYG